MTLSLVQMLFSEIPGFNTNYGADAIVGAVQTENLEILKYLITKGVDLNNPQKPSLGLALLKRNTELIKLLIDGGADPYRPILPNQYVPGKNSSYIDAVLELKSATLLKLLDRDRKYTNELKKLEQEMAVPPNSPFIGAWAFRTAGFGSMDLVLNEDGTGLFSNDIGVQPCFWKPEENTVTLYIKGDRYQKEAKPQIILRMEDTTLRIGGGDKDVKLVKQDKAFSNADAGSPSYPPFMRVQKVCLAAGDELCVQINGKHTAISLERLIKAAKADNYGSKIVDDNVIPWADFKPGPIPAEVVAKGKPVAFVNKPAIARYREGGMKLMFDQQENATIADGFDYTLFPCSDTLTTYHGRDTGNYGERVIGYVLLSKDPVVNGREWVMWYVRRSKTNLD